MLICTRGWRRFSGFRNTSSGPKTDDSYHMSMRLFSKLLCVGYDAREDTGGASWLLGSIQRLE
ncbi:MAG: hypothetical protein ACI9A2_003615 [Halioglobus sp.]|jgi:hypothetical protein